MEFNVWVGEEQSFLLAKKRFQGSNSQKRSGKKCHKLLFHSVKWKIVSTPSYGFDEIIQIKFR